MSQREGATMRVTAWFRSLDQTARIAVLAFAILFFAPLALGLVSLPIVVLASAMNPASQPLELVDTPENLPSAGEAPSVATSAEVVLIEDVPFQEVTVPDPTRAEGTTEITTVGVPGTIELVYRVSYLDGVETGRVLVSETVVLAPVDQVTSIGTYVEPPPVSTCDPNYADGCVPIASDVDCAGGSGNGPAYVSGVVRVVGSDIYDLDRDSNGYGCD